MEEKEGFETILQEEYEKLKAGKTTINEIRNKYGLPSIEGGDKKLAVIDKYCNSIADGLGHLPGCKPNTKSVSEKVLEESHKQKMQEIEKWIYFSMGMSLASVIVAITVLVMQTLR